MKRIVKLIVYGETFGNGICDPSDGVGEYLLKDVPPELLAKILSSSHVVEYRRFKLR